jgi:hypothetical protein
MMDCASDIIHRYQQDIWHMPFVTVFRTVVWGLGLTEFGTKLFLVYLFIDEEKAWQCLNNVGLLRAEMKCSVNVSPCQSSCNGLKYRVSQEERT